MGKPLVEIALKPEPTDATERRAAERQVTIFRTGRLSRHDGDELCIIRNISPGGAMVHVCEPYNVGETVILDLRAHEQLPGSVAWVRDTVMGIKFDHAVDLSRILSAPADTGPRARAPRLTVPACGRVQIGEDILHIVTADVSQGGAKIFVARALKPGTTLRLWLDGFCSRLCTVRWSSAGVAGLAFDRALSVTDLSLWTKRQRTQHLQMLVRASEYSTDR